MHPEGKHGPCSKRVKKAKEQGANGRDSELCPEEALGGDKGGGIEKGGTSRQTKKEGKPTWARRPAGAIKMQDIGNEKKPVT